MMKGVNLRFSATNAAAPVMRQFQRDLGGVQKTVRQSSPLMRSWNAGLNSNRRAVQQFGFQMSDFAIQIAGGQSAMLAFTQQGGQMLQFFGPAGALAAAFLAVFGSLAIAFTRSGKALSDLFPLMGVLQDEFRGIGRALVVVKELLIDFANLVLNNLDVILISGSLVAGFFIGKWVAAFIAASRVLAAFRSVMFAAVFVTMTMGPAAGAAAIATSALSGALSLLRVTLVRLGIPALVIGMGYLIERFMHLRKQVGSSGEALDMLANVAREAFLRMGLHLATFKQNVIIVFNELGQKVSIWANALEYTVGGAFDNIAGNMNRIFGLSLDTGRQARVVAETTESYLQSAAAIEDANRELRRMRGILSQPWTSLQALRDAMGSDDGVDIRDWFGGMGDAAEDGAGRAADAIDKGLTPALERLKSVQDMVSSAFESAMMSVVDGTKSAKEAFKAMASDIIKELYRIFVVKQITGFITDAIGGMFGAGGSAISKSMVSSAGGGIKSFDGGGFTWKGPRAGGVDGKGGRMAILHPNESVTDHTKGGSSGVTVIQNNTFNAGVTKSELTMILPKLVDATKAAIADGARRGGSYGKAFG